MASSGAHSSRLLGFRRPPGSAGVPPAILQASETPALPRRGGGALGVLVRRLHGWHLCGYLQQMRISRLAKLSHEIQIRRGKSADLDALLELENQVFATDRMSRRSLRRLLASESPVAMWARAHFATMGAPTLLFPAHTPLPPLSSLPL